MADYAAYTLDEFPPGLWRVHGVGPIVLPPTTSRTPLINLTLAPVDGGDPKRVQRFRDGTLLRQVRQPIGSLPGLAAGLTFRDGKPDGAISLEIRHFTLSLSAKSMRCMRADTLVDGRPDWWKFNYRLINQSNYYLPKGSPAQYAVFEHGGDANALIIPCAEILRAFYTPDSKFAQALCSTAYRGAMSTLCNLERSGHCATNDVYISLRRGLDTAHAALVARLLVDPVAQRRAQSIFTSMVAHAENNETWPSALPYVDAPVFRMRVAGVPLQSSRERFLGLRILARDDPSPGFTTHWTQEFDGKRGEQQIEDHRPRTIRRHRTDGEAGKPGVRLAAAGDAVDGGQCDVITVPGVELLTKADAVEVLKAESTKYVNVRRITLPRVFRTASTGNLSASGEHGEATMTSAEIENLPGRIGKVVELLDSLHEKGTTKQWRSLPGSWGADRCGKHLLARLPVTVENRVHRWAFVNPREALTRVALVAELKTPRRWCYWVEVEERPLESFRSLVVSHRSGQALVPATIDAILEQAVLCKAVWRSRDNQSGAVFPDELICGYFQHRGNDDGKLSIERASALIRQTA